MWGQDLVHGGVEDNAAAARPRHKMCEAFLPCKRMGWEWDGDGDGEGMGMGMGMGMDRRWAVLREVLLQYLAVIM